MAMLNSIKRYTPTTWTEDETQKDVPSFSEEYQQIQHEVKRALDYNTSVSIKRIIRVQDLYSFGQFLIREQLLLNSDPKELYRMRRYIQINRSYLNEIVKYNLDPRRCGMGQSLAFCRKLSYYDPYKLVVVVKVLTTEPDSISVVPATSTDYYVEYVVEIQ